MNVRKYISCLEKNTLTIFLFHGVIREQNFRVRNHNKKHILETEFIDLVSALGDHGQPISINDLVLEIDPTKIIYYYF